MFRIISIVKTGKYSILEPECHAPKTLKIPKYKASLAEKLGNYGNLWAFTGNYGAVWDSLGNCENLCVFIGNYELVSINGRRGIK